jgi:hypothetical protein
MKEASIGAASTVVISSSLSMLTPEQLSGVILDSEGKTDPTEREVI